MGRPKTIFTTELASRAQADLDALDHHGIIQKLRAIIAASKNPISTVSDVIGVADERFGGGPKHIKKRGLRVFTQSQNVQNHQN